MYNNNRKALFSNIKNIVIKIGTSSITKDDGSFNQLLTEEIAKQTAYHMNAGKNIIIVSSGAIGIGCNELNFESRPNEIPRRQAAAAVGQNILMQEWNKAFNKYNIKVAQILLTYEAFSNKITYNNLRNSIAALTTANAITIINENDPICVHEIEETFGDNDKLSAIVASKIDAQLLIVLSDVDGLYNKDPIRNPDAQFIKTIEEITPDIENYAEGPISTKGLGGMKTKIEAAKITSMAGCHMVIANSSVKFVVNRILDGDDIGTLFLAKRI